MKLKKIDYSFRNRNCYISPWSTPGFFFLTSSTHIRLFLQIKVNIPKLQSQIICAPRVKKFAILQETEQRKKKKMSFHLVYLFIRRRLQEIDWGPVLDRKDRAGAGKYSAEKKEKRGDGTPSPRYTQKGVSEIPKRMTDYSPSF